MNDPIWLELKVVLMAHDAQLAQHGGLAGVRDFGLLESAMNKPKMAFAYEEPQPDMAALAALYMVGISRNHPFNDANKRTALLSGLGFLRLNGWNVVAKREEEVFLMPQIAQGEMDNQAVAEWLRSRLVKR